MDDLKFQQFLDTYGADLSRWPTHMQEPARAWLAASPLAQQRLHAAQKLDALLSTAAAQVSQARAQQMVGRALEAIAVPPQARSRWPVWMPALLFAAAAAGCATGLNKPEWIGLNTQPQPVSVVDAALTLDALF